MLLQEQAAAAGKIPRLGEFNIANLSQHQHE
jgi:hypothetical protein